MGSFKFKEETIRLALKRLHAQGIPVSDYNNAFAAAKRCSEGIVLDTGTIGSTSLIETCCEIEMEET